MATLTIADLDNGKRDLETVDAVANSPADFTPTRFGDSVLTLAGALRRLGYQPPVPYASGLNVDSGLFTVLHDGLVYAPDPTLVPFTTGAWDASQWRVVQNTAGTNFVYQFPTLGAAQAAAAVLPNGSAIIVEGQSQGHVIGGMYVPAADATPDVLKDYAAFDSYTGRATQIMLTAPGVSGLWVKTNSGKTANGGTVRVVAGEVWERQETSPIQATWFGVSGTQNSVTALKNVLTFADGATILLPEKVKLDGEVLHTGPVSLVGTGTTVIDCSGGGWLNFDAGLATLPYLSGTASMNSSNLTFQSNPGLVSGDVVILHNPTDFSFAKHRSYYTDGEMVSIDAVLSATQVSFFGSLSKDYPAASLNVYRIKGGGVSITGVKRITPTAAANGSDISLFINGHKGVHLRDLSAPNSSALGTGIEVCRSFDIRIENPGGSNTTGDAYPLVISNSQKFVITGAGTNSSRHCVALGGRSGPGTVPTRDGVISDSILYNSGSLGYGAADVHGNVANVTYNACIMRSGAHLAGRDIKYNGCVIYSRNTDCLAVFGSECVGGSYELNNCRFMINGVATYFGVVNISTLNSSDDIRLSITNATGAITKDQTSAFLRFAAIEPSTLNKTEVRINGIGMYTKSVIQAAVWIMSAGNVVEKMRISIDGVDFSGGLSQFLFASNRVNDGVPVRLPIETGVATITPAAGQSQALGSFVNFRTEYPRTPVVMGSVAGATVLGNKPAVPSVLSGDTTRFRPALTSGDATNWSASVPVTFNWSASIRDF
ncbi:MAG: hypothetical protein RSE32_14290 [Comamonas sp.]|uniref:phage tailspike polysaccharide lyase family protein n=1 Tax=Comamonas sp. TaxID=34028 RepID=UPI002FC792A5